MKRRLSAAYFYILIATVVGAGLRLWSLSAAVDEKGLPIMHLSLYLLFGLAALVTVANGIFSRLTPCRSGAYSVLQLGTGGFCCGLCGAVLVLLGACVEFAEALAAGPTITAPIMLLLGLVGSFCLIGAAFLRRIGRPVPAAEVLPIVYLVVKLILNFKSWSVDPIILDYCVILFSLIFSLLAVYGGAGFVFGIGKPRRTLFYSMEAVFFCAGAMMDGIADLRFSTVIFYGGILLWLLPMLWDLLAPNEA